VREDILIRAKKEQGNIKGAFVTAEEARCPCAHHEGM
jgi:hypothetical protein